MRKLFDLFLYSQYRLCKIFDKLLPAKMTSWGYRDFILQVLPGQITPGMALLDVGGGKSPAISIAQKKELQLKIIGLDISEQELKMAPVGSYDQIIAQDICKLKDQPKVDLIVCLAVLEHVKDPEPAIRGMASLLNSGGKALIFVPSRNSIYAQLNLLLPQAIKKVFLELIYAKNKDRQGFKSYYHKCTPAEFKEIAENAGLNVVDELYYFQSGYFSFFLPFHMAYRLISLLQIYFIGNEAAETFTFILEKSDLDSLKS